MSVGRSSRLLDAMAVGLDQVERGSSDIPLTLSRERGRGDAERCAVSPFDLGPEMEVSLPSNINTLSGKALLTLSEELTLYRGTSRQ